VSLGEDVLARIASVRVVPVVEVADADDALPLARTLRDAGLPVVEVTLRTPVALAAIERIAAGCPDVLVGAGSLLDADAVAAATSAGARFGVAPGLHHGSVLVARRAGLPFIPGVLTPSEVLGALDEGLHHLKFFPAASAGGVDALGALAAPFASAGVRFMPTGGVTAADALAYLARDDVFAVGGSWVATRGDIASGDWPGIATRARAAVALARRPDQEVVS
jgi:2-dehydro-3-deoxyphosphogluconate aldolase / (4S)-4-hydroxy-2-oxoglutarate aldolase